MVLQCSDVGAGDAAVGKFGKISAKFKRKLDTSD